MRLSACRFTGLIALALMLPGAAPPREDALNDALRSIRPGAILQHIKVLASDEYEGRGPGTPGEDKTIAYLTGQLRAMGLKPGNPDGTYLQNVPLIGFQASRVAGVFRVGEKAIELEFPRNFVAMPGRAGEQPKIDDSDIVFVGYGVQAPEYGWDDFKGLDLRGKTLIMLVGDPPVPDPSDPAKLDPAMFKGRAMTYCVSRVWNDAGSKHHKSRPSRVRHPKAKRLVALTGSGGVVTIQPWFRRPEYQSGIKRYIGGDLGVRPHLAGKAVSELRR